MSPRVFDIPAYRNKTFIFKDRFHAGDILGEQLLRFNLERPQVLAIPSGGVPVGYSTAKKIVAPLDVMVVRKIQIPWNPEAGFGAVAWDGTLILNEELVAELKLTSQVVDECISRTKEVIRERLKKFRGVRPMPAINGRQVILVDDGLASGFTMLAAIKSIKQYHPEKILVAVPTGSEGAVELVAPHVSEVLCLNLRRSFVFAVADAYQNWYDLSDEEVMKLLNEFHAT